MRAPFRFAGSIAFAHGDPHSDWLPSGSRFGDTDFAATWGLIADEIAASV